MCEGEAKQVFWFEGPRERFYFFSATFTSFLLYARTLFPSVQGGDSGELITAAYTVGIPHPPGFPLFCLLGKLFTVIAPFGSVAFRIGLMSAVCGAVTAGLVFVIVFRMTRSLSSSILSAVFVCFNRLVWLYHIGGEVFALNNLLCSILLFTSMNFEREISQETPNERSIQKLVQIGACISSLGMCNQHTIVLYVLPIVFWVLCRLHFKKLLTKELALKTLAFIAVGLLPLLYLPIVATLQPFHTWGRTNTPSGFLHHFLRTEYGTFDLGPKSAAHATTELQLFDTYKKFFTFFCFETWFLGPLFCAISVAASVVYLLRYLVLLKRESETAIVWKYSYLFLLMTCFVTYTLFFFWRANLKTDDLLIFGVFKRFWMQPILILCLMAGFGCGICIKEDSHEKMERHPGEGLTRFSVLAISLGIILVNFMVMDMSSSYATRDFAETVLSKLPRGSILITRGDLGLNTIRYIQDCEDFRTDVVLADFSLMTFEWHIEAMKRRHRHVSFPGVAFAGSKHFGAPGHFSIADFVDANIDRGNIFTFGFNPEEVDVTWMANYLSIPVGIVRQFVKKSNLPSDRELVHMAVSGVPNWTYVDYSVFDDEKWENMADLVYWSNCFSLLSNLMSGPVARNDRDHFILSRTRDLVEFMIANQPWREKELFKISGILHSKLRAHVATAEKVMQMRYREYLWADQGEDPQTELIRTVADF